MRRLADFYIRQHDTLPAIRGTLQNEAREAIDLSEASAVLFRMKHERSGELMVEDEGCSFSEDGTWEYVWQAGDTARVGKHLAVVIVDFAAGGTQTFPSHGNIVIEVAEALDEDE